MWLIEKCMELYVPICLEGIKMGELVAESKVLQVFMGCDKCKKGEMRPSGTVLPTYPPQFPHKCTVCGFQCNYPHQYPYQRVVAIEHPHVAIKESEKNPDEFR